MTTYDAHADADLNLVFKVTDEKAFREFIWNHPGNTSDWEWDEDHGGPKSTPGCLLELFMFMAATLPGVECYAGSAAWRAGDNENIPGRTPQMHRHVTEHAHPVDRFEGRPHTHHTTHGDRIAGPWYMAEARDPIGPDLLSDTGDRM